MDKWEELKKYIEDKNESVLISDFESDIYMNILEKIKELENKR